MKFDFVIVGGGTAGCVLASRLSEDASLRICLVEAGPETGDCRIGNPLEWPALQGSSFDWQYETEPQAQMKRRRMKWPRGRILGGSTGINAMAHVRGHPSDFDAWADAGCRGWGFADLLPYFRRSEDSPFPDSPDPDSPYRGRGGPVKLLRIEEPHPVTEAFMAAAGDLGMPAITDHNGGSLSGVTLNTLTIANGRRQTVADAYLDDQVRGRENLTLLSEAVVTALHFDAGRCVGVPLRHGGEAVRLEAERGVVLCAGAIASPALLLRAGIGDPDALRTLGIGCRVEAPGVGRNLQDHLLSGGNLYEARVKLPVSKYQHSESLLYSHAADADSAPRIVLACVAAPVVTERFAAPEFGEAYTIMFGFTHPQSRGRLWLESADPAAAPRLDPNYLAAPADMASYLEALDWARDLGARPAFKALRGSELLPRPSDLAGVEARRDFLRRAAYTHHHPAGTCKMGPGADAVVGSDLAVHGTAGLYVVDASVMPSIPTGPINAAVIAIAERASDLLRGRLPLKPESPDQVAAT